VKNLTDLQQVKISVESSPGVLLSGWLPVDLVRGVHLNAATKEWSTPDLCLTCFFSFWY
jgi:hypothetical protein